MERSQLGYVVPYQRNVDPVVMKHLCIQKTFCAIRKICYIYQIFLFLFSLLRPQKASQLLIILL